MNEEGSRLPALADEADNESRVHARSDLFTFGCGGIWIVCFNASMRYRENALNEEFDVDTVVLDRCVCIHGINCAWQSIFRRSRFYAVFYSSAATTARCPPKKAEASFGGSNPSQMNNKLNHFSASILAIVGLIASAAAVHASAGSSPPNSSNGPDRPNVSLC